MDVAKAALESKITQLKVVESRTDDIIKQGNRERTERQHKTLKELVSDTDHYRTAVEELKIAAKENQQVWENCCALKWGNKSKPLPFSQEGYNRAKSILTEKCGKTSEIVKAYAKEILELPWVISGVWNIKKIHEFNDRLGYCVQSLETMGKLKQVDGYVSLTSDKLPGIRGDLVRTDQAWERWDFIKLCEALRLWARRNPSVDCQQKEKNQGASSRRKDVSKKLYHTRDK